ncbi:MAG TPA: hypothetical protein VHM19_16190, partial [Polyangiales bacterium]|nr:hypothetical protein [Polyangiales bacterium]
FMALGSISLLTSLVLYVPWLCTAVTHALGGEEWVISRYGAMRSACFDAVCPWVLGLFVPRVLAWRPVTALAALGMIAWGFTDSVDEPGSQRDPYYQHWNHWNSTLRRSEQYAREAKFLRKNVKPGRVVLVPYYPGTMLVAQYDLHLLAIPPSTGSPGIPGMALRRAHQNALLREGLSMAERDALLRYYHVRYLYVDRAHAPRVAQLYRGRIKRTVRGPLTLFEIALPRPRP